MIINEISNNIMTIQDQIIELNNKINKLDTKFEKMSIFLLNKINQIKK